MKVRLNYKPAIAGIALATAMLFVGMAMVTQFAWYHPIAVSVEYSCDSADYCQLYYDNGNGFIPALMLQYPAPPANTVKSISFQLPPERIFNLRIDPGIKSTGYNIRRINVHTTGMTNSWTGRDILKHVTLINLKVDTTSCPTLLKLRATNNFDSQIFITNTTGNAINSISRDSFIQRIVFFSGIYFFSVILILVFAGRIVRKSTEILAATRAVCKKELEKSDWRYLSVFAVLLLLKIFLTSYQHMSALTPMMHDDALFIKLAYNIAEGHWLGEYNHLTLVKGFFYPFFIAVNYFAGLPLMISQLLLCFSACFAIVQALTPLIPSKKRRIILFTVIFFNPVLSVSIFSRVLRDDIYPSLLLLLLASLIGLYLNRKKGKDALYGWSFLGGISLFALWNTREEGWLVVPFMLWISLLTVLSVINTGQTGNRLTTIRSGIRSERKTLLIVLFPYLFLLTGNFMMAAVNYVKYDSFLINEIKSKPFSDAFSALSKIAVERWTINIPVSREARHNAYKVSPAFKKLEPFLEADNNPFKNFGVGVNTEIKGGWFMWAFRDAVFQAGYHQNLATSQNFYSRIATEINAGFATGKLTRNNTISIFGFSWDNRFLRPAVKESLKIVKLVSFMPVHSKLPWKSRGNNEEIEKFQVITHEPATLVQHSLQDLTGIDRLKYHVIDLIARLYHLVNRFLLTAGFLCFIFAGLVFFIKGNINRTGETLAILLGFLYLVSQRILLVSIISVSLWNANNYLYLNIVFPLMFLFTVISIFLTLDLYRNLTGKK